MGVCAPTSFPNLGFIYCTKVCSHRSYQLASPCAEQQALVPHVVPCVCTCRVIPRLWRDAVLWLLVLGYGCLSLVPHPSPSQTAFFPLLEPSVKLTIHRKHSGLTLPALLLTLDDSRMLWRLVPPLFS